MMSASKLPSLVTELSSPSPSWRLGSPSSESVLSDSVASVDDEGVFGPAVCPMAEFAGDAEEPEGVCEAKDCRIGSFRLDTEERRPLGSRDTGKRGETPQTHSSQVVLYLCLLPDEFEDAMLEVCEEFCGVYNVELTLNWLIFVEESCSTGW
jgi:hypothetical protein